VAGFRDVLSGIVARIPEAHVVMIMGTDGIPVEKLVVKPDPALDAVAAECTGLLRASVNAAADTGLGRLDELSIVTEKMVAILVAINPDYYFFVALGPGAVTGRARHALRVAGRSLEQEFA
jgi:predicted regulator of Ras-like GTPase activity (Roadblock/LC7/MglB family)